MQGQEGDYKVSIKFDPPAAAAAPEAAGPASAGVICSYIPCGSKITGTVQLETSEENVTSGGREGLMQLFFTGKEYTKTVKNSVMSGNSQDQPMWNNNDMHDVHIKVRNVATANCELIKMPVPLVAIDANSDQRSNNNTSTTNTYTYTFEFKIPETLPSSMVYTAAYKGGPYCRLLYQLEIEAKEKWLNISAKKVIPGVIQTKHPSSDPLPNSFGPITIKSNFFCCIPAAEVRLAARINNSRIGPGEALTVNLACSSGSPTIVGTMKVREFVKWKAEGQKGHNKMAGIVIAKQSFRLGDIMVQDGGGGGDASLLATTERGMFQVSISIPESAYKSYKGRLIAVSHVLEVQIFKLGFMERIDIRVVSSGNALVVPTLAVAHGGIF